MKKYLFIAIAGFLLGSVQAQWKENIQNTVHAVGNINASGILKYDLLNVSQQTFQYESDTKKGDSKPYYSPFRAALYSAVLPGSGQFYTKSYFQSALFFTAEVALWVLYAHYTRKGDNQTSDFQRYADEHWSVVRYARWLEAFYPQQYDATVLLGNPPTDVQNPWEYINWSKLNEIEDKISQLATLGQVTGFTHRLPPRPEQQYYELIGKYSQYGGGWDDASYFTPNDVLTSNVSPRFRSYSAMRGKANDFYAVATTAAYCIVANHIFNALEAAWNAARVNKRLSAKSSVGVQHINHTYQIVTKYTLSYDLY